MRLPANDLIVRRRSRRAEDSAATPAAGVAGVGRDAGLLAEILQVQLALRKGIRVRFLHANGHNRATRRGAVFGDQDLIPTRVVIRGSPGPSPGFTRCRTHAAKDAYRN